jgi:hypothetical protein
MVNADLPIIRHQLALARATLEPCFKALNEAGDGRGYHSLGPVTLAEEMAVLEKLANISDALSHFAKWSQVEGSSSAARYVQHCREAAERISRLQDNKQALSSSRRLLERHMAESSRRKFLEQLEAIAREASVPFFSYEDEAKATPANEPTHCMSGQTFVLDFHVDSKAKVPWTKLQRILTSGDGGTVPSDSEAGQQQWQHLNASLAIAMQSRDLESALRDKFQALQRVEDAHSKYPQAHVYDNLHALENAAIALHAQHHAAALASAAAAGKRMPTSEMSCPHHTWQDCTYT